MPIRVSIYYPSTCYNLIIEFKHRQDKEWPRSPC